MCSPPAPDVVLELLTCKCVRSCKMPNCTRLSNGLQDDPEPDFELGESDDERDEQFDDKYNDSDGITVVVVY